VTCPVGQNFVSTVVTDPTTSAPTQSCMAACNSNEAFVKQGSTVTCQVMNPQNPQSSTRHEIDVIALGDQINTADPFKTRILKRKNFSKGPGTDPNIYLPSPSSGFLTNVTTSTYAAGGLATFVGVGFLAYNLLKKK